MPGYPANAATNGRAERDLAMASSVLPVVVGVDGGPGDLAAVGVAAAEAASRHRPLRIVHAVHRTGSPLADVTLGAPRAPDGAGDLLTEMAGVAVLRHPDLSVQPRVVEGSPAVVLLAASASAALVVVGSRGAGGFAGLLLGSTAAQVATHGRCPVLVVRAAAPRDAPVLLAVDALDPARGAIGFAFREADLRGVHLHALFGWTTVRGHPKDDLAGSAVDDFGAGEAEAQRLLAQALSGWSVQFPDVKATLEVYRTVDPSRMLVEASSGAGLIVVGSHRRSDLHGVLLGSAAYALVHRAGCPVAVVHPDDDHREEL
jgi:nucleotide-binding universal stress UspA family protein